MAKVMPRITPMMPPSRAVGGGLDEELKQQDVVAARAERLADTYFPRAFGDRDQHDVHDDDAAHHQRRRRWLAAAPRKLLRILPNRFWKVALADGEGVRDGSGPLVAARARDDTQLIESRIHQLASSAGIA